MAAPVSDVDDDEVIAQINIIPFVDITLVLLIIFLLTSSLIARASIPVELPRAASSGESVDPTVNVVLTSEGVVFLDGKQLQLAELRASVAEKVRENPKTRAAIAADKSVRYERVIEVIDSVKRAGVVAFALNIELAPSGG